ncbi:Putative serine/threonine-protein kinase [Durusdinium trenchii]|uniref:Serine/threonine-protein kinase n=2 Tax=Durusdinium trenchii TaxID=1381693 RepID=A0ABP0NP35_9DINO
MGLAPSCQSCDHEEVKPVEPIEAIETTEDAIESNLGADHENDAPQMLKVRVDAEDRTVSKIKRGHLLERKLTIDKEIMRAVPLSRTLRGVGRLWRRSPLDMPVEQKLKLWNRSCPVEEYEVFFSHTWHTAGLWKFLSLSLQLSFFQILLWWLVSVVLVQVLFFAGVLPQYARDWLADLQGYKAQLPRCIWTVFLGPPVSVLAFFSAPYLHLRRGEKFCFLDCACIHQADATLMERGIYGLGGFLKTSKELRILWSPPYFSRLWCVFEVAAYRMANPHGKITVKPLFVEVMVIVLWLGSSSGIALWASLRAFTGSVNILVVFLILVPFLVGFHMLRKACQQKQQLIADLRTFDLQAVECRVDFDKKFVHAAITEWYGGPEAFTEYVRGPLRRELEARHFERVPFVYSLILATPLISYALASFVSLVKAGAPANIILSYFFCALLGMFTCYATVLAQLSLFLCDRFAHPLRPGVFFELVQTFLTFVVFALVVFGGMMLGSTAYRASFFWSLAYFLLVATLSFLTHGGAELLWHHFAAAVAFRTFTRPGVEPPAPAAPAIEVSNQI